MPIGVCGKWVFMSKLGFVCVFVIGGGCVESDRHSLFLPCFTSNQCLPTGDPMTSLTKRFCYLPSFVQETRASVNLFSPFSFWGASISLSSLLCYLLIWLEGRADMCIHTGKNIIADERCTCLLQIDSLENLLCNVEICKYAGLQLYNLSIPLHDVGSCSLGAGVER